MMSREQYHTLLNIAVHAPSGDNAQPWRFVVGEDTIDLFNIPGKDSSPYNFVERGSFFAHGTVIENLCVLFSAEGYATQVSLFPTSDPDHVARLIVAEGGARDDGRLAPLITLRRTNRKPYRKMSLSTAHIQAMSESGKTMITDQKVIADLAKTVSLSDRLIFEDKSIHDAIFSSIRWTPEEEREKKGLYIKTLELPPPAQILFKRLKNWNFLKILNHIGISKLIAAQSAKGYAASSAMGVITMESDDKKNFVRAGQRFQRLWLIATEQGISLQPVTALAYLAQRITAEAPLDLSPEHQDEIMKADKNIRGIFGIGNEPIAMIFRMGYGEDPTAQSQKTEAHITYTEVRQ